MKFQKDFFMQILGIVSLKWGKRFIDDGFNFTRSNTKDFLLWGNEFNNLRKNICIDKWKFGNIVAFMDLYVFKGEEYFVGEKFSITIYIKKKNLKKKQKKLCDR